MSEGNDKKNKKGRKYMSTKQTQKTKNEQHDRTTTIPDALERKSRYCSMFVSRHASTNAVEKSPPIKVHSKDHS